MKTIIGQWATAANGTVRLELSKYAIISGTTDNAPRFYQISLDSNGAIPAGYEIWANDELMPEGTSYKRTVFGSSGLILFGPDQVWICGTAPINVSAAPTGPPITPPPTNVITISPGFLTLQPGQQQQFTANMAVTWSSSDSNITSAGLYTAPNVTTSTPVTITATSVTDPTNTAQVVISVQSVTGITVSISPGSASLAPGQTQSFTATLAGTTNQNVVWSTSQGTITQAGLYTAPSVTSATTVTVTATSVADSTKTSSVQVSVQPVAVVSVTVAPTSAALTASQTQQFSAVVSGSVNQAVTWALTGDLTGPAYGTISSTGLYTAPATVSAGFLATITATSVASPTATASVNVAVNPPTGTAQLDLLQWTTLTTRSTQHLAGDPKAPYEVQWLDTDSGYPSNYPSNTLWFVKNKLGNPWDVLKYDSQHISHWMTENGDAPDQAACQAANGTSCWLYARAYKRKLTPVPLLPRFFTPGTTITLDTPAPTPGVRTTNCESTVTNTNLGPVRCITTGPFKISWGGSIDHGTGTLATAPNYDAVNGVDTIKSSYQFTGSFTGGFSDVEETYYVLGFGRVAWYSYHAGAFVQKTVNTTLASGGHPALNFPCGPGKSWFI